MRVANRVSSQNDLWKQCLMAMSGRMFFSLYKISEKSQSAFIKEPVLDALNLT
jgi:hypothetical protein